MTGKDLMVIKDIFNEKWSNDDRRKAVASVCTTANDGCGKEDLKNALRWMAQHYMYDEAC